MNSIPVAPNVDGGTSRLKPGDAGIHPGSVAIVDAAIFYTGVSVFLAVLMAYFRQPLGSPGMPVIAAYWLVAAATMFAYAIPLAMKDGAGRQGTFALACFIAASTLTTMAGYPGLVAVVAALGVGLWINRRALPFGSRPPAAGLIACVAGAAIFAMAAFVLVNSMQYATVFSPEKALTGMHNRDQLFHAAIASMFAGYGVAGTGLDGLQPFRYHLLSHIWLGLTAKGFGVNSIFGYFLGMQIVAVPLIYFSLTVSTTAFGPDKPANRAVLLAMPIAVLFAFEHWNWLSYLISESHILGLILLLLALPMLKGISRNPGDPLPYATIALGFALGLLALAAKVSVGFVWFAGFLYLSVRANRVSRPQLALYGAGLLVIAWIAVTFLLPVEHSQSSRFVPFHFFRLYPSAAMANLIPIGLAATLQIALWRSSSRPDRVWRETVVIMLMASVAPTFILQLDGGSAYYFINIGTWIAVAALAGHAVSIVRLSHSRIVLAACLVVIAASFIAHPDRKAAYAGFQKERDQLLERVLGPESAAANGETSIFDRSVLAQIAQGTEDSVGSRLSRALDAAALTAGDETLVFIEPGADDFWSMNSDCTMPQFLVPAYFGVPLLKGLPPVERACDLGIYYSLASYGAEAASSIMTDEQLCRAALTRGFATILVVSPDIAVRPLVCN